jgi:hypothetical protein
MSEVTPQALLSIILVAGAGMSSAAALAAPAQLPAACATALSRQMPGWSPRQAPPDAAAWARGRAMNPVVARGDFDGDRRADWAALISVEGKVSLVFCLGPSKRLKLVVVSEPYCNDLVTTSRAGARRHNLETSRDERLARDGASVSCFEKAGATYVLETSRVRRIIDSD